MDMKAAIRTGMLTAADSSFDVQPTCSTGNCSWPLYQSLAVCSFCADVTGNLTYVRLPQPDQNYNTDQLLLPNNLSLNYQGEAPQGGRASNPVVMVVNSSQPSQIVLTSRFETLAFPNHNQSLVDVIVILLNSTWTESNHLDSNSSITDPYIIRVAGLGLLSKSLEVS